ncbi:unnamed protein product [Chrysodeixis includens]|uniref:RING-type domain-containing protein n=1 Tax=Chrysodeixis includens TaxID=689277 RepID=A0A9N8KR61_CHRIL|nr:unnamed protein product [Chrysodeixis includens]
MEQHPECSIDSQGAERPASEELQEIPADSLSPVLYIDDQGGSPPALEEVQEDSIPADDQIPEDIDVRRATPPAVEEVQKIRRPALILGFYVDVQDASPRALQELQDNLIPGDNIPEHDNDVLRASPPALEEEQDNPIPADDIPESSDVQCATAPVSNEEEGIPGDNIPEYLDDQEASPPATLEDIQYIPLPDDMSDYYDVPRNGKRSASDEEQEMLRDALIRSAKRIKDEEEQDNPIPADDNSRSGCFAIKNMGRDQVPGTSTDATPRKKNLLKLKIFKLRRQLKINRFRSRLQTKALRENLEALRSEVTRTTALLVYERERRILADEKAETAVKTMGQIMESNFYCSICNQAFINAILLNCAHTFCKYCITMWQRTRNNCPICRAPVTVKSSNLVVDGFIEYLTINLSPEVHSLREKQLQSRQGPSPTANFCRDAVAMLHLFLHVLVAFATRYSSHANALLTSITTSEIKIQISQYFEHCYTMPQQLTYKQNQRQRYTASDRFASVSLLRATASRLHRYKKSPVDDGP